MKSITFNREELYKVLWAKPMTQIAKEHNINSYQLTKACHALKIPRPRSGYWSKLRNGIKVNQKPLNEELLVILDRTNFREADSPLVLIL